MKIHERRRNHYQMRRSNTRKQKWMKVVIIFHLEQTKQRTKFEIFIYKYQ
jgi:hypothetical protein